MTSTTSTTSTAPRLKARYREEIVPALKSEFAFGNIMQVPSVTKVVVNMGVGEAARDSKLIEGAIRDQDKIDRVRGMDITVVTTAQNDAEGRALLRLLGFPFKEA